MITIANRNRLELPHGLDTHDFLRDFWQQRPLLMPEALPGFRPPLSAEELAGLACEDDVEARLVLEHGVRSWEVRHGPFAPEDFRRLPESHWTLLVQDVDKHLPDVSDLLDCFDFIPDWRLDDIMISYAADQGSVGPHVDDYDVFLVQAAGRRRWCIDTAPAVDTTCIPGLDLRILETFQAREQWVLEPGDLLYLPPGIPHWGIAEGPCMTWSVGLRSPAWRELAAAWCDQVGERHLAGSRYRDPAAKPPSHPGEIPASALAHIRSYIESTLLAASEDEFAHWFGAFISETKEHLEVEPPAKLLSRKVFLRRFERCGQLERRGASRLLFTDGAAGEVLLFAGGTSHPVDARCRDLIVLLTEARRLEYAAVAHWLEIPCCADLLCKLYNLGHHEFPE